MGNLRRDTELSAALDQVPDCAPGVLSRSRPVTRTGSLPSVVSRADPNLSLDYSRTAWSSALWIRSDGVIGGVPAATRE